MLESELDGRQVRLARGETLGRDLVSLIAPAECRDDITRQVVLDNLFTAFTGGSDTTVRWMGNAVAILYRHPKALTEIHADPALLPRALEEVMRLQAVTRFAIRTVTSGGAVLGGQLLAPVDTVYLLTSAANRDPAVYRNLETFDLHRQARPHMGFSYGVHQCIGMHLARVEAQALIAPLIKAVQALKILEVDYGDTSFVTGPERLLVRGV